MDPHTTFQDERSERIESLRNDDVFASVTSQWLSASVSRQYVYDFDWMGRPIIQYPQDILAMQELIWKIKPDLIIETGIAHGGSLILSASMLAMLEYEDAVRSGEPLDPSRPVRHVLGVDIDIRQHNRAAIEDHPMASRIEMIEGSSVDPGVVEKVHERASRAKKVLVALDSNHTHDHVLAELNAYAGLVSNDSYCVVFDTFVETLPRKSFPNRPWDVGNSPLSAVRAFLSENDDFQIDATIAAKLQITAAPDGFLRRSRAPKASPDAP